jgi:hypothetical protein
MAGRGHVARTGARQTIEGDFRMKTGFVVAGVAALGLALAVTAWFLRDAPALADAKRALGAAPASALQLAGVHKCVGASGTRYLDGPCPAGSREVAVTHGTMTVTSFPKPAPAPSALGSAVLGGPLVKPLDPEERDRLRDQAIEDAANRR